MVTGKEARKGSKIVIDGDPYTVLQYTFTKPGKGRPFCVLKVKNLINKRIREITVSPHENLKDADVDVITAEYLYSDSNFAYFMHMETYETIIISLDLDPDVVRWLCPKEEYGILLYNENPIDITPPNFLTLQVLETDAGLKGSTTTKVLKRAVLNGNIEVHVPLFVETDDMIVVDTRDGTYHSRV